MKEQRKASGIPIDKPLQKIIGLLVNELKLGSCNLLLLK
jgi:hypothetical protein